MQMIEPCGSSVYLTRDKPDLCLSASQESSSSRIPLAIRPFRSTWRTIRPAWRSRVQFDSKRTIGVRLIGWTCFASCKVVSGPVFKFKKLFCRHKSINDETWKRTENGLSSFSKLSKPSNASLSAKRTETRFSYRRMYQLDRINKLGNRIADL